MANWFDGVSQDVLAHVQKSGWDKLPPEQAAVAAAKSHLEAQNYIGTPADKLIRLPAEANDPAWKSVWSRLGAPVDAKGYDLSGVKFADGTVLEAGFIDKIQAAAYEAGVPAAMVQKLAGAFVGYLDEAHQTETTTAAAALKVEKDALAKEWGANFNLNLELAKKAAAALGVTPETTQKLEDQVGYQGIMKMFQAIGSKIGEDKFVGGNQGSDNTLSRDQALTRLSELKADEAWATRVLKGDATANNELKALNVIIAGGDDTSDSMSRSSSVVSQMRF